VRPKRGERGVHRYVLDRWSDETLPVNCFLVERPNGLVLFDAGQTALAGRPDYLPRWHPFLRLARFELRPEDEAAAQLSRLGYAVSDVRTVVLSHLHTDHVGGLAAFQRAEVVVTRLEWERATGLRGALRGYLPRRWPRGLRPRLVEFAEAALGPFPGCCRLLGDDELVLVPIPGHTPGHAGLLVREQGRRFLLIGDAAHRAADYLGGSPRIEQWARSEDVTVLAAHDPTAAELIRATPATAAATAPAQGVPPAGESR
jgi:N-acyl homoserine lactone hydrolase